MNLYFYHCKICGKVIAILSDTGVPTICCGEIMEELIAGSSEGSGEKHLPVYCVEGNTVRVAVGSEPHPMKDEHLITWIGLQTAQGFQFRELAPGDRPEAAFTVSTGDRPEAIYAYCNIHGLWCTDITDRL